MKIGFDAKRLYCNFTGLGNHNRATLAGLLRQFPEHEYHLYTPRIVENAETRFFLEHEHVHTHRPHLLPGGLWRSFGIPAQLKADGIELYHGLSNELPVKLRAAGVKSVVTIMDLIFKVYPGTYNWIDRQIYDLKYSRAARQADAVVAISEATKRDLVRFYGIAEEKIEVIYPIVNELFLTEGEEVPALPFEVPESYFLYVGSVTERKNLALLVEAYRLLPESYRLPVLVVGNGKAYKKYVMELLQGYGLSEHFWWLAVSDNRQLKQFYRQAKGLIYPSLYEGFGLPVVEAHFCRTPVITSNVSSLPEAAGPHAITIDPSSSGELAEAIRHLLDDEAAAAAMAQKAHTFAWRQFHPEKLTRQLMDLYSTTLQT
jgi:glycosyltransferase involved in cell wall biosynthesis